MGDIVSVHVEETVQGSWPQVMFCQSNWSPMPGYESGIHVDAVPKDVRFEITTNEILALLQQSGAVFKGDGIAKLTRVELIQEVELAEGEKGDPVHNV